MTAAQLLHRSGTRPYDDQIAWLRERVDPASTLERDFLETLVSHRFRLPDFAQFHPGDEAPGVYVQPDFYYEREGRRGVCVFIDGPAHDAPDRRNADDKVRAELTELGFPVVVIHHARPLLEQVIEHPDVFGPLSP